MKTIALITEYNPFHFGHLYHLNEAKKISSATHSICIMSSSFVQRGEPAIVDKWSRAKMAIDSGVDLVIELPFLSSVQTAELFAYGSVRILDELKTVDYLIFGSESGDLKTLQEIACVLCKEPYLYKKELKENLKKGLSFPISRNLAIANYFSNYYKFDIKDILNNANNILAVEYLKALNKLSSNIKPLTIKRVGHGYNDLNISNSFNSASAIRRAIFKNGLYENIDLVPEQTFFALEDFLKTHKNFNSINNYYNVLNYKLISSSKEELKKLYGITDGLENRIIDKSFKSNSFEDLIGNIASKSHTRSRIRRALLQFILNTTKDEIDAYFNSNTKYIRILGANKKGFEIINKIKKNSEIRVLTKFTDYNKFDELKNDISIKKEILATNMYYYGISQTEPIINADFTKSPYITK
ncbi:MAG: nucleotidyltransferase [Tissierellales bacterium]|nr:nucleotidyltransferase [Tissierellales bacterium]